MPCETRRVVVLTTDAYQRLKSAQCAPRVDTETQTEDRFDSEVLPPPASPPLVHPFPASPPSVPPVPVSPPVQPAPAARSPSPPLPPPPPPPLSPSLLDGISSKYRPGARDLLKQLEGIPELSWDPEVHIRGRGTGVTISELLRGLCVPFVKLRLPPQLRQLVSRHKLKCRNHLVVGTLHTQPWHQYFQF